MKFYAALSALAAASFVPLGASLAYTYPALTQNLKAAVSVRPSYPGPPAGRRTSAAATTRAPRLLAHATPAVAEVEAAEIGEKYSYLENDVKRAIEILLSDHDDQPLGSLSADVLDLALPACASLASARTTEAAEAVEKIVRRVEGERAAGSEKILPWRILYSVAIDTWAKSGHPEAARRAEAVLKSILPPDSSRELQSSEEREETNLFNPYASPNTVAFNAVIDAYAKTAAMGDKEAPANAERILKQMEQLFKDSQNVPTTTEVEMDNIPGNDGVQVYPSEGNRDALVQPNTISYTSVINAYAQSSLPSAAEAAERVFACMERAYNNGDGNDACAPNARSFNAVINAYIKGGKVCNFEGEDDMDSFQTSNVFYCLFVVSFDLPISPIPILLYINRRQGKANGSLRAEEVLRMMIELHDKGEGYGGDVEPTVVSFTTVINGWAQSPDKGSADRALGVFRLMDDLCQSGKIAARPNAFTYSTLINALVRSGNLQQAEDIFNHMVKTYQTDPTDPRVAKPNTIQLTQIASAWSKSGDKDAGIKAEELLTRLENLYDEYREPKMRPNALTYTAVINAWARSRTFGKALRAVSVLQKMKRAYKSGNDGAVPNVNAYTAVLNACAFTVGDAQERKEAMQIAATAYKELCASTKTAGRPNQFTYATFLRVCSNLIPGESKARVSSIYSVFKKCCDDGCVDELVLRVMRNELTDKQLGEMLQPMGIQCEKQNGLRLNDVPAEWKCNIVAVGNAGKRGPRRGGKQQSSQQ